MFVIDDGLHCDLIGEFATRDEAIHELQRFAAIAWDQPPNRAPCSSWETCGRRYDLIEYDDTRSPWRALTHEPALEISHTEVRWLLSGVEPNL